MQLSNGELSLILSENVFYFVFIPEEIFTAYRTLDFMGLEF